MRQMISGLVAAIAVMAAGAPAMACGLTPCAPVYTWPVVTGCGCGPAAFERLPDPETQYYYVNQGPTYTGPGAFAPYPTYQESAVHPWGAYRYVHHAWRRGYRYGYAPHRHVMRYGYAPYHYGHVLRRYY